MTIVVNEIWYAPVLKLPGRRRPLIYYEYMSPTRKGATRNITMNSYRGQHDWEHRKNLGWTIERITITNGNRA